jgi:hypothetical protein
VVGSHPRRADRPGATPDPWPPEQHSFAYAPYPRDHTAPPWSANPGRASPHWDEDGVTASSPPEGGGQCRTYLSSRLGRPARCRRCPPQAWPELVGHNLDDLAGAVILSGPGPLLEPTHDHDPAPFGQRLGGMLSLVAPHDHGEERQLLLSSTGDGHPEQGPGDPTLGVADRGSSVRLPAKLTLASVMCCPPGTGGRAVCPARGPRGTVDTVACSRSPGASDGANEVGHAIKLAGPWPARVPSWLVDTLAAGGRACQHRPARSLHPERGRRTRLPPRGLLAVRLRLLVEG